MSRRGRFYDVVWFPNSVFSGKPGSKRRQWFSADQMSSSNPDFPSSLNIVSVTRVRATEKNVPEKIVNRGKHTSRGPFYYNVVWKGSSVATWETRKSLGVYDFMADQFDERVRLGLLFC